MIKVVDASVIVKMFIDEGPSSDKAKDLLGTHLSGEHQLAVPDLLIYELGNVLWRKREMPDDKAIESLSQLFSLEFAYHSFQATDCFETMKLARHFRLSFYDAS